MNVARCPHCGAPFQPQVGKNPVKSGTAPQTTTPGKPSVTPVPPEFTYVIPPKPKRGRPKSPNPLSNAERQRLYRARLRAKHDPIALDTQKPK